MTRGTRFLARLVVPALVAGAAGLVGITTTAAPAAAATCSGSGVSVVVDPGSLGGGVRTACASGGAGQSASSLFSGSGFSLAYVQNEPGFVCRIDQQPAPSEQACVTTPPSDAYWGLWWSDGKSGTWNYSNYGVGSLKVPDGGSVAFAWQGSSRTAPGVAAPVVAAAPAPTPTATASSGTGSGSGSGGPDKPKPTKKPTPKPTPRPTPAPSQSAAQPSPSASGSTEPSESASAVPTTSASASPSASETPAASETPSAVTSAPPSASAVETASPTASSDDPVEAQTTSAESGALPAWVVPLVILLLAGGAGVAFAVRRRQQAGS